MSQTLHPAQSQIAKDTHRFRVVNCGRRFGKSTLSAYEMLGYAMAYDNVRVPYYAPTRDDARDIMWAMLNEVAGNAIVNKNESRLELLIRNRFGTTSLIALYGWEAVQERKKGVGVKNKFIVLDEVAKYRNFWAGWHEVLRPTLTDLRGESMFISTPNGFNHFYDLYNKEAEDEDYKSFHFTSFDNPFIPVDELYKAKRELPEDKFAQEYMADFRKMQGLVYKEFSREKHVFKDLKEIINPLERIAGVDFGFSNPAAVVTIVKDYDSNYWVTEEWYKTQQTEEMIAEFVASKSFNKVYADPENPSAIAVLKQKGVNLREVIKGPGSIMSGINRVRELFLTGKLKIHYSCVNLLYELETYCYPDKQDAHNADEKPIKDNDHALDALRYPLMMQVVTQDRVKAKIHVPNNLRR